MKQRRCHLHKGFTLTEVIAVLAIASILAAVAVPSILGFVQHGKQIDRTNIARTIYLGAQSRLTEMRITKTLDAFNENRVGNVYEKLKDSHFPANDMENKDDVYYISKAKDVVRPDDPVIRLLDPVIMDKMILRDAILIEYNIKTGVVLSAFYGDMLSADSHFTYVGTGDDSVMGGRGMDEGGYEHAKERKQGYYGVDYTGGLGSLGLDGVSSTLINVYDSYELPLPDDTSLLMKNVLYAEILIPEKELGGMFDLLINDQIVESNVPLASQTEGVNTLSAALSNYNRTSGLYSNTALCYRDNQTLTTSDGETYARFIWVLDYVGGDMGDNSNAENNTRHSIGVKYKDFVQKIADNKANLRAGLQGSVSATSANAVHPYFFTEEVSIYSGDRYTIASARHLYNIRYLPNGNFTQAEDINLAQGNAVTNFAPIPTLTGTYTGTDFVVQNLIITSSKDHVGLFSHVSGIIVPIDAYVSGYRASVVGLALENPNVTGGDNVGSVCGTLDGLITGIYVRYTDPSTSIRGAANVGGIVGLNNGTIADSTFISSMATAPISGTTKACVGGIAGANAENGGANKKGAELKRILYLAVAPDNNQTINPIVGDNHAGASNLIKLYYLSGLALRPAEIPAGSGLEDYNAKNTNGVGEGIGTLELYGTSLSNDWRIYGPINDDSILSDDNRTYPYPFSKYSATQVAAFPDWPIVDGGKILINNIAYYERYNDNSYGLWYLNYSGEQNLLKNNRQITEAGYLVMLDRKISTTHFFARTSDVSGSWKETDHMTALEFKNDGTFAQGIAQAAGKTKAWVAKLPLDKLSVLGNQSKPLQIMYTSSTNGAEPEEIEGFLHPLFAKGIYEKRSDASIPDPEEYYIRTPWQMKNIGALNTSTAASFSEGMNYTTGKTFTQELNLDYAHTGIGVNVSQGSTTYMKLLLSAVDGTFYGTYDGGGRTVSNVEINATGDNIGLFSVNSGTIKNVKLKDSDINGRQTVGSIAGHNTNTIQRCGVEYSTVSGNNTIGGIAGSNTSTDATIGRVEDVYFLSTADLSTVPISAAGGGIIGYNDNSSSVTRALYIAPAPASVSGSATTIYPIVRSGKPADQLDPENGTGETCFYLSGYKYALDQGSANASIVWTEHTYNLLMPGATATIETKGGGMGILSKFLEVEWLGFAYGVDFSAGWSQGSSDWSKPSSGYPYPILSSMTKPTKWSVTDSPVRPDQLDRTDWETTLATSNRASNLDFINGDFELDLMDPNDFNNTYTILKTDEITRAPSSQSDVASGGFTTGIGNPPSPSAKNGSDYYGMYTYYDARWVPGWNTRPVNAKDASNAYANMIEFQRPYSTSLAASGRYGRVRTNYKGTLTGAYIELNADVPGTLYQICATVPGTEMYYSFYHARRNAGNETGGNQRMNFYLSGMTNNNGEWVYADNSGRPTIIRPCITPRGTSLSQSTTRNTVVYGTTGTNADEPVSVARVDFYDPEEKKTRNAYLYDVWVSNLGYGITFWSDTRVVAGSNSGQIPTSGVSNINNLPSSIRADASKNIIGYWHVAQFPNGNYSEWKQYYGLYTIPAGQITTEFAYESASTRNEKEGNYLDGITFRSPGFLSIEKYAKMGNMDVMFVKPGDTVTIELHVKSWGESPVNNIVIKDQFAPYTEYITYGGVVVAKNGGAPISNVTVSPPAASDKNILTITLPAGTTLSTNEELVITFDLEMRYTVASAELVPTLLYYFKNQATVSYTDTQVDNYTNFAGYYSTAKKNASGPGPLQVFIDPIKLSKTAENTDGSTPGHPVDGPFKVTLRVENALSVTSSSINTNGIITDLIPKGFELTGDILDDQASPVAHTKTPTSDGDTRITIRDVQINTTTPAIEYTYHLAYTGKGYGVLYTDLTADYRYVYSDGSSTPLDVYLKFPQPVVGVKVKTLADTLSTVGTSPAIFNITKNDNFAERYTDGNYDVTPEVLLFDSEGNAASKNANGDYQINHTSYTAILLRSTSELQFTPKDNSDGTYEFYYQIQLDAKKPGGTPELFNLSSPKTTVTVTVSGTGEETGVDDPVSGGGITTDSSIVSNGGILTDEEIDDETGDEEEDTENTFPLNPVALAVLPLYLLSRSERFHSIRLGDKHAKGK